MKKNFFIIIFLIWNSTLYADNSCNTQDKNTCCAFSINKNTTKISRLESYLDKICALSISTERNNISFRRFGLGSDGQFSIYIHPGGFSQNANSTQSYLIYPFGENPTVSINTSSLFSVDSGSGQIWRFNSETNLPVSIDDCEISVSSNFNLENSGVNISNCQNHLIIKTPLEIGGEAIAYPDLNLTITDPDGGTCQIKTNDLYNYLQRGAKYKDLRGRYYNIEFKFKTNRELGLMLRRKCPRLDVSMLVEAERPTSAFQDAFRFLNNKDDESGDSVPESESSANDNSENDD